jgi:stalled ribosome alternative rescue factor ArfA
MRNAVNTRSPYAKALESKIFRMRTVAPKKGKGAYKRCKKIAA